MKKSESNRRVPAAVMGIVIIILMTFSTKTVLLAEAAEIPVITDLEVITSEDGSGVSARCSYQNYTEQSGCEMRLYLYKVENGVEAVESQKALVYAEQGNDITQSKQVEDGVYRASVTMDDGVTIRQINSSNYYRVSKSEGSYTVTEETEKEDSVQKEMESQEQENRDIPTGFTCSHECEYFLIEQATPVKDAIQAYQCVKCGAVLEYMEIPNSAYAAFLKEAVNMIQNAQQEEVTITTDRWISFNKEVFETLKMKPDLSVKVNYQYHGEACSFVIPAGADVEALMDENGFAGFRYIEGMAGQVEQVQ